MWSQHGSFFTLMLRIKVRRGLKMNARAWWLGPEQPSYNMWTPRRTWTKKKWKSYNIWHLQNNFELNRKGLCWTAKQCFTARELATVWRWCFWKIEKKTRQNRRLFCSARHCSYSLRAPQTCLISFAALWKEGKEKNLQAGFLCKGLLIPNKRPPHIKRPSNFAG